MIYERNGFCVTQGADMTEIAGSGNDEGYGWKPMWGEMRVVQHIVPNIKSNQSVVDLAGAVGRVSFPFSMRGHEVTIVDTNLRLLKLGNEMRTRAGAKQAQILNSDIRNVTRDHVGSQVGAVVAHDALMFMGKEDANKVIASLPKLLGDEGGYVYLNALATLSPIYRQPDRYGAMVVGNNTLKVRAGCHGGTIESGFFEFGEINARLALSGGVIINSETVERGLGGPFVDHMVIARFSPDALIRD